MSRVVSLLAAPTFVFAACATSPAPPAVAAGEALVVDTLYFGTAKADGRVTSEEWQQFVDTFVTPRFPTGLTWWKASGQWKGERGLEREETFVLQLAHPLDAKADGAIEELVAEYKRRFAQEAVLRLRTTAGAKY